MNGGPVAIRGYLVQTLVALLDGLGDQTWVSVILEPEHKSEKIDILWEYVGKTKAVQVKSSVNPFENADVKRWARDLEASKGADEYELILVGVPSQPAVAKARRLGSVAVPVPRNLDLSAFRQQAAHLLDVFMAAVALPTGGAHYREMLADALVGKLETLASKAQRFTRGELVELLRTWISQAPVPSTEDGREVCLTRGRLAQAYPVPEPPPHFVRRPEELQALKDIVLSVDKPVAIIGLQGMGGIGKSVLAACLAREDEIRAEFPDGIFWIVVGQSPAVESLRNLATRLRQATAGEPCLVILDDVWDAEHATVFRGLGPKSRLLLTTRDASLIHCLGAVAYCLNQLTDEETLDLLAEWSGERRQDVASNRAAQDVMRECGNLPLALAVCGAMRRDDVPWAEIQMALQQADLEALYQEMPGYTQKTVLRSLHASVDFLRRKEPEIAERYLELAVFPEDALVPETAVATLWIQRGLPARRVGITLTRLKQKSLLRIEGAAPNRRASLHDLQRDYVRASQKDLLGVHEALLDGYRKKAPKGWHSGPNDGYFFQQLGYHLVAAGRRDVLRSLLFDSRWLQAQLGATDPNVVAADYDRLPKDEAARLVRDAIRLSSHVLFSDKAQLAAQLIGRLSSCSRPAIAQLLGKVAPRDETLWLRPMTGSLMPPGGGLIRTLEGHTGFVTAVAVTPDGGRAISASDDKTLKVWDLRTGRVLRTLEGHVGAVFAVAVTPDGGRAVSASDDKTLKVWDLRTGRVLRTLEGHVGAVFAVAVTPDGGRAVSASSDRTLVVWDLSTGETLRTLRGHAQGVMAVAVTLDGRRAVSASSDRTLVFWSLRAGKALRTLRGHAHGVMAVAVTPGGTRAVSASLDQTLVIWNLRKGEPLHTLGGHAGRVMAVAVTPNGKQVVSASSDGTLMVWDLRTRKALRTLQGHAGMVRAVTAAPNARQAVSASEDRTLKVWDLRERETLRSPTGHVGAVMAVAVTPNGRHAVSASSDRTLVVWDLRTGKAIRTLQGHVQGVMAVAVTPNGRQAVSASSDETVVLWDLRTGEALLALRGHTRMVRGVAVTPEGSQAISASNDLTLKLWDLHTGKVLRTLKGHTGWCLAVAVTPDGHRAVSASNDQGLRVWDLRTGRALCTLEGHTGWVRAVAVTPDGGQAISASDDKTLRVWDLATGKPLRVLKAHAGPVVAVAVTPDGRRAVSASWDKTLKVWDLETGELVAQFRGDTQMYACAAASDGRTLVAGDAGGSVHFLRLEEGRPARDETD